jgi:hypothetical protein
MAAGPAGGVDPARRPHRRLTFKENHAVMENGAPSCSPLPFVRSHPPTTTTSRRRSHRLPPLFLSHPALRFFDLPVSTPVTTRDLISGHFLSPSVTDEIAETPCFLEEPRSCSRLFCDGVSVRMLRSETCGLLRHEHVAFLQTGAPGGIASLRPLLPASASGERHPSTCW